MLSQNEKHIIGQKIANFLGLDDNKETKNEVRYNTFWGSKSNVGLYESILRIIDENTIKKCTCNKVICKYHDINLMKG